MELVRSIGADHVIDYMQEDFTKKEMLYDLILAAGGSLSIFDYKRALSPKRIYVCVGGPFAQYFQAMLLGSLISMVGSKKLGSRALIENTRISILHSFLCTGLISSTMTSSNTSIPHSIPIIVRR